MSRSLSLLVVALWTAMTVAAEPVGVRPLGKDGRPLNLDFETGDLRDWLAEGQAFRGQPIKGDTVFPRRPDSRSEHQGQYWIGGYEKLRDTPKGKLVSASFEVTHPYASFLVGGGPHKLQTCVEIVRKDTQKVIFRAPGRERENMHREVVDLRSVKGKEIFVRLIDEHTGHWGHVNFDDFRFHKDKPTFAGPKKIDDVFEHAGLSAEKAARAMTLPKGFSVQALAAEPDLRQPIAMTIDDRGRVWVAEAYSYPVKVPAKDAKDRILIFEDTTGDGKLDKRTVFVDKLNLVSGLEVGFGGVWVGQAPELLFIPDRNGDDKPDGPPEVVLDGWGYHDTHETLNSFIWGPDGWLYGCHGVFTHSKVGKPGTPAEKRVPINAGIWRYHPIDKKFEVFAYGTSNPWGVDFNDKGHAFLTCCVIPHLFHVIQGARYQRQAGSHFQRYTYSDIPTIAKHRHWVGNQWNVADRARSDALGGGHAHAGAMFYLGGVWPKRYRGQLFMNNIHGARLNVDRLTPKGSGYVGDGEPDFCKTNDLWSQIVYLRSGPDGQVYMIDWYDRNQCHERKVPSHDRSNGRLFRISYEGYKPVRVNLGKMSDAELVGLQTHENDWYVRHSRRLLQERAAAGKLADSARKSLAELAFGKEDVRRRLRGLWGLHVTGGLTDAHIRQGLGDSSPDIRAWTIQLACEKGVPEGLLPKFTELAKSDPSPVVRLYLASALQRVPVERRWAILEGLLAHDDGDHNLPLMYWYSAEPLAEVDAGKALRLASRGRVKLVTRYMTRRVASLGTRESLELVMANVLSSTNAGPLLKEVQSALSGKRRVEMPENWSKVFDKFGDSENEAVRDVVWALAVKFGDPSVRSRMRRLVVAKSTGLERRRQYLASLLAADDKELVPILFALLDEEGMRRDALRALARFPTPQTPRKILERYAKFSSEEKRAALNTLVSREAYAKALLEALATKRVPNKDLTADLVRQLHNLGNADITNRLEKVWGTVRKSPAEKAKLIADWKGKLKANPTTEESLAHGRAIFAKTCQRCHTLFGRGGDVGPDLTGSNRADLDYLLSNVIDPSAVLGKDYVASVVVTESGQVLTGLIREQDDDSLTLITAEQTLKLPRGEIESITPSNKSMMPDALLEPLAEKEVRALVGYLASPRQVPMLATKDNAATLFNGKDLTGWVGNEKYWRVADGEIVGVRPDAPNQKNEFLVSELVVRNFRLKLEVKLTPDAGNSGIQFRSELLPDGEVKGYQADIGAGWWGKLYEEHGRGLLWPKPGDTHVKKGEWNAYEIVAEGDRIRTYLNGKLCVDLTDAPGRKVGHLALQVHSGKPFEVRFRKLTLEVLP